jgi:hypothetical protein
MTRETFEFFIERIAANKQHSVICNVRVQISNVEIELCNGRVRISNVEIGLCNCAGSD